MMNKQERIDSLLRKASLGTTTTAEDRELTHLYKEKMEAKAKGFEWDIKAIKR